MSLVVESIVYSGAVGQWIGCWPLAPVCLRRVSAPDGASGGPPWVVLDASHLQQSDLPVGLTLSALSPSPFFNGLIEGSPLVPRETLFTLRQPLRFSFRAMVARSEAIFTGRGETMTVAAKQQYIYHAMHQSQAVAFASLSSSSCPADSMCPCYFRAAPVAHDSPTLCPWCDTNEHCRRVCCKEAFSQRRPGVPRSPARTFFMDFACPGTASHGSFTSANVSNAIAHFDTLQTLAHHVTCRPTCPSKAGFEWLSAFFTGVPGMPPSPLGIPVCPASVTELVCEYLGRRTTAMVLAPLFMYTCVMHPSALDLLPVTGPLVSCRTPTGRLHRIANTSHYYHVLTLWVVSHSTRVRSLRALSRQVLAVLSVAGESLVGDAEPMSSNHVASHRRRRKQWADLYLACHDPSTFLAEQYISLCGDSANPGVPLAPVCVEAGWPMQLWPLAVSAVSLCVSLEPVSTVFFTRHVTHDGTIHWEPTCVRANVCIGSYHFCLSLLRAPGFGSDVRCEPSCIPIGYTQRIAEWVALVCARPRPSRKRARRLAMVTDPWSLTPESTRSFRHLIPYATESDSDATETEPLAAERIEETSDEYE